MSPLDDAVPPADTADTVPSTSPWVSFLRRRGPLGLALCATYGALCLAGWWWDGDFAMRSRTLHPYVLFTLVVAVRVGWVESLLVSLGGTALLGFAAWRGGQPVPALTEFWLLLTPLAVGALLEGRFRQGARLRQAVADQGLKLLRLSEKNRALEIANENLRARASEEESGLERIHHIAQRLAVLEEEDLYPGLVDVVAEALGAEACSVYVVEGRSLKLMAEKGWATVPPDARSVDMQNDLLGQVVSQKRVRTVREFPLHRIIHGDAPPMLRIMGAPVQHPVSGRVLAVLSVESLPFRRFTRSAATLLGMIGDLAGKAMAAMAAEQEDVATAGGGLLNAAFFRRRVMAELQGRQEGRLEEFAVGALRIKDLHQVPPGLRPVVERAVEMILEVNLRDTDVRARLEEGQYAFLLPASTLDNARNLERLLGTELVCRSRDWLADCQAASFHVGAAAQREGDDADGLMKRCALDAKPCETFLTAGAPDPCLSERHGRIRALLEGGETEGLQGAREDYALVRILERRADR